MPSAAKALVRCGILSWISSLYFEGKIMTSSREMWHQLIEILHSILHTIPLHKLFHLEEEYILTIRVILQRSGTKRNFP